MMKKVPIRHFFIGPKQPLAIIAGPCVIESEEHCLKSAETLKKIFAKHPGINFIFKASYDKANRSSYSSFRGPGLQEGLRILDKVKNELDLPIVTDVHSPEEAKAAAQVCDIIQIPAFLSRQTDLIVAAAMTGTVVQVKKGQFMAPWDMKNVVKKITTAGNEKIILVDRGTSFGYNTLISDFRCIPIMQELGFPVCFDATHSVQQPAGKGESTGGQREFIPILAKAALAVGANALFIEAHDNPKEAKSDSESVLDIKELPHLLTQFEKLYELINA